MGTKLTPLVTTLLTLVALAHQSSPSSPSACPPYFNGSIAGNSCSQEYIVCIDGIEQKGLCDDGLVFYGVQSKCIDIGDSPECAVETTGSDDEDKEQFDCSTKNDGSFQIGCSNEFVQCVAGYAYPMFCPEDLVFVEKYGRCLESCDEIIETSSYSSKAAPEWKNDEGEAEEEVYDEVITSPSEAPYTTTSTASPGDDQEEVDFDCSQLADGNYPQGCSSFFYICVSGKTFLSQCPTGLVYNPNQRSCDYECHSVSTTTPAQDVPSSTAGYESTTSTTTTTAAPTTTTTSTAAPTTTTTTAFDDQETSTTPVYVEVPETTTSAFDDETTTTTFNYTTTPGFDDVTTTTTTTQVPVCPDGQIVTFGQCASRFTKCQNNAVRSKQCPTNTLFEPLVLLCVFESPECQPKTVPVQVYGQTYRRPAYGQSDTVVSPFDDGQQPQYNTFSGSRPRYSSVIPNPFFNPSDSDSRPVYDHGRPHYNENRRHHNRFVDSPFSTSFRGRALLDDQFKDHRRVNMDRIKYKKRRAHGNRVFQTSDKFDGRNQDFLATNINQIFEKGNSKRNLGPREYPDNYDDASGFDPKDLFGATRRKRSASYSYSNQQYGGSTQVSELQARVNAYCKTYTKPTFLSFGDCFDQFIYCSGTGTNRFAACPIGESFDRTIGACSDSCGVGASPPVVTTTQGTFADVPASQYGNGGSIGSDQTTTGSSYTSTPNYGGAASDPTTTTVYGQTNYPLYEEGASDPATTTVQNYDGAASDPTTTSSSYYDGAASDQSQTSTPSGTTTTTVRVPIGQRCAQHSNALLSLGCSQEYIHCSSGVAIRRICPAALYFDESRALCDYRDAVSECVNIGSDTPTTTASPYSSSSAASPSSTYSPTLKPYNPTLLADDQQSATTTAPIDACSGLPDGSHGEGCSASYIVCNGGKLVKTLTCSLGQGFDPSAQICKHFEQISAWACDPVKTTTDAGLARPLPYISLDSVRTSTEGYEENESSTTSSSDDAGSYAETGSNDDDVDDQETSEEGYETTTTATESDDSAPTSAYATTASDDDDDSTEGPEKAGEEDEIIVPVSSDSVERACIAGSRASLGFCVNSYLECNFAQNKYTTRSCSIGQLFDVESSKCVEKSQCGHATIKKIVQDTISTTPASYRTTDRRCFNAADNSAKSLGTCRTSFIRCSYGQANVEFCPETKVFSPTTQGCVDRDSLDECKASNDVPQVKPVKSRYYRPNSGGDAFCDGKPDGLFKNPSDCSGILQCFGGDMFEYPSCPSGLAFNEKTGKCDYPQSVPGCEKAEEVLGECSEHGSFLADADNCSIFYRCVWGSKIGMKCPSGTVFNPDLSVCDWPSSVPQCGSYSSNDSAVSPY